MAAKLSAKYPEYHFVPVFISGSEDHDFDEVKSLQLFGKTITWDTIQSGSVGRFNINGLDQVTNQIAEILGTGKKRRKLVKYLHLRWIMHSLIMILYFFG